MSVITESMLCEVGSFIQSVKQDWEQHNAWTEYDQTVQDRFSAFLHSYAQGRTDKLLPCRCQECKAADRIEAQAKRIAKLEAALAWQPIETAPKDHLPRLLWAKDKPVIVGFLDVTGAWWPSPAHEPLGWTPTHWMPRPAPPSH